MIAALLCPPQFAYHVRESYNPRFTQFYAHGLYNQLYYRIIRGLRYTRLQCLRRTVQYSKPRRPSPIVMPAYWLDLPSRAIRNSRLPVKVSSLNSQVHWNSSPLFPVIGLGAENLFGSPHQIFSKGSRMTPSMVLRF